MGMETLAPEALDPNNYGADIDYKALVSVIARQSAHAAQVGVPTACPLLMHPCMHPTGDQEPAP